ncbi:MULTISPECIES: LysR family transcriptional regulator [unclassified Psychrobacter]|uniref:LysR family transcriptional regulator n=1 Tax=unclassified Psychrobacter TaxID=196806 RepID=UPI00028A1B9B|nr:MULTISPECIES: LysR family transcriptional regulator [unclassified Psychrobacter]MBF4489494.1 LysR family transcriptional regulator [Psychrobacter sp. N25K4-3-2]
MLDELIKIDIKTLRSFMAIVECQGVTAAQSRLNVTTSVISGHLTHLEDRLGMTLCHRGRAGFKLTEDGAAVYEACLSFTEAVASFQHQLHYIRQLDSVHGGHIRLCLIDQMPTFFYDALRQCLAASYRDNPLIHFSIDVQSPESMLEKLLSNESDIGVGYFGSFPPLLTFQPAFIEKQVVCCGREHRLFYESEGLTFEDLEQNYPWIKRGYITDLSINHVRPKTLSATTYHMEATAQLILAGHHVGYLPNDLAKRYEEMGLMKILLPTEASYEVKHHWAYRENLHKQVADFLSQMMRLLSKSSPKL